MTPESFDLHHQRVVAMARWIAGAGLDLPLFLAAIDGPAAAVLAPEKVGPVRELARALLTYQDRVAAIAAGVAGAAGAPPLPGRSFQLP